MASSSAPPPPPPSKVIVAAGTYDGVLAGWQLDGSGGSSSSSSNPKFKILFASPEHEGSVRSLSLAASRRGGPTAQQGPGKNNKNHDKDDDEDHRLSQALPGSLLSCGYDEMLRTHDFSKHLTSSGEVRTPADFGTPTCSAFAPPMVLSRASQHSQQQSQQSSTHCLLGFSGGKLVIYKKRDWNVQHVLNGHEGGVASLAVHPTGKLALTGGEHDGKLKLWDLTKGRLSYASKIRPTKQSHSSSQQGRKNVYEAIVCIVWSPPGNDVEDEDDVGAEAYAFCYGNHVTVRDTMSGKDLLDVDLPSKVNQVCLLKGEEGLFLAAACDDGSLPVLAVSDDDAEERGAIMAIEPVDGPIAGEERFKCIQALTDYHVVTANSAGVISLMNLRGAVNMISSPSSDNTNDDDEDDEAESADDGASDEENDEEEELAVDIIDSVPLGSGARITSLVAWCQVSADNDEDHDVSDDDSSAQEEEHARQENEHPEHKSSKRKQPSTFNETKAVIDADALEKARSLVAKAKKIQKRKEQRKIKKQRNDVR